jgi:hypothetical protein
MHDPFAGQMAWQRAARRFVLFWSSGHFRRRDPGCGLVVGDALNQLAELQFKLVEESRAPLR